MWKANWSLASMQVLQILQAGKMLHFSPRHISSPLYYCNASELMWCGHYLCGLWWAVHLLITGLTLCCITATYKKIRTFNAGSVLLDVSIHFRPSVLFIYLFFPVDVVWAWIALLSSSLLEKALNVTVVLCQDPNFIIRQKMFCFFPFELWLI